VIPFYEEAHEKLGAELRTRVGAMDWASDDPADMVAKLGLLHVFPLLAPEKSVRALCVAREVIAYASPMADSIFAVQGLASHPLALAGVDRWRARIDDVLAGRTVGGFALTEPEAGSDVASLRSTARRDGDGWRLDGEKTFISNVGIARYFIVFANADPSLGKKGITAFLVEADARGLDLEPIATIDDHPLGRLVMRGAHAHLVGDVGQGLRLALGTLDVFRTSVGGAAIGMAERALDETVARVKERKQFGQRLADFQLVQAALADMKTELDASRLLVYRAAWWKDRGERASEAVAMAKMYATEAAQRIIDRAVQLHGGLGVTAGRVVESLYREIRPLRIYEGTTEIQKLIIGGALVKEEGR
jgi:acyl-CoA dehydrogenase